MDFATTAFDAVPSVVHEFYANLLSPEYIHEEACVVTVRGVRVTLSVDAIREIYSLPVHDLLAQEEYTERPRPADIILQRIATPDATWKCSDSGAPIGLYRRFVNRDERIWQTFICNRIFPTSHKSDMSTRVAQMIYDIHERLAIPVAQFIYSSIEATTARGPSLGHPGLITELCRRAGVPIRDDENRDPVPHTIGDERLRQYHAPIPATPPPPTEAGPSEAAPPPSPATPFTTATPPGSGPAPAMVQVSAFTRFGPRLLSIEQMQRQMLERLQSQPSSSTAPPPPSDVPSGTELRTFMEQVVQSLAAIAQSQSDLARAQSELAHAHTDLRSRVDAIASGQSDLRASQIEIQERLEAHRRQQQLTSASAAAIERDLESFRRQTRRHQRLAGTYLQALATGTEEPTALPPFSPLPSTSADEASSDHTPSAPSTDAPPAPSGPTPSAVHDLRSTH